MKSKEKKKTRIHLTCRWLHLLKVWSLLTPSRSLESMSSSRIAILQHPTLPRTPSRDRSFRRWSRSRKSCPRGLNPSINLNTIKMPRSQRRTTRLIKVFLTNFQTVPPWRTPCTLKCKTSTMTLVPREPCWVNKAWWNTKWSFPNKNYNNLEHCQ